MTCTTGFEVYCIGGGAPASSPQAQACRDANLTGLHELLAQVHNGMSMLLCQPKAKLNMLLCHGRWSVTQQSSVTECFVLGC